MTLGIHSRSIPTENQIPEELQYLSIVGHLYSYLNSPNHNFSLPFSLQPAVYGILRFSLLKHKHRFLLSDKVAFGSTNVLTF